MSDLPKTYASPRWSHELLDCSMPMTLDTYNRCAYNCLYCFSYFQRANSQCTDYAAARTRSVDPAKVKRIFTDFDSSQFGPFLRGRPTLQWGGLSDQFDEIERKHGVTLDLLRFFRELEWPICFSTKATWWTEDPRYVELFQGAPWNVKVSIITLDERKAAQIERGVPSPRERLDAIERIASWDAGGATLRLRPFVIGASNPRHAELITEAANRGAEAVSAEFLCVESRMTKGVSARYNEMSKVLGFDIFARYKQFSQGSGYLRLNREIKRQFVDEMEAAARAAGIRFAVSDAHFKERCDTGSCCGLGNEWSWSRGQFTEALVIARREGRVRFSDVSGAMEHWRTFKWSAATGYNKGTNLRAESHKSLTMFDFVRRAWNMPNAAISPYRYFGGVLVPDGVDKSGDVVYRYAGEDAETFEPSGCDACEVDVNGEA